MRNRVGVAGGLAAGLLLSGCSPWEPDADPPRRTQIACVLEGAPRSAPTLVFILDTGRDEVIWANGPDAPRGRLAVEPYVYRFDFPATAGARASAARINRYDGVMVREIGGVPFLFEDAVKVGNVRQTWRCETQAPGAKV